ncbi:hypothetical protein [Halanaerobacter jeridensis]|uniref:hypothetical protein n=1 Tax=Halanaerobacter jeridensis TaxID=706427 RepID=UPI00195EBA1F|nr:hypothetical protein [Halanaerobacter jeridensis]
MYKSFKVVLILCLFFALLGCGNKQVEEKNGSLSINQSLLTVNSTNENIIERLEQFYFKTSRPAGKQQMKSNKEMNQEQQKEENKDSQKEQMQKIELKKKEEKWKGLINKIEQLFKNWNRYESEKSLDTKQAKKIEKKMNQLTQQIENNELLEALFQANGLNLEFAKLYRQYYNKKLKSTIEEMRVYVRNIVYLSQIEGDNQTQQSQNLRKLKSGVNELEDLKMKKENKERVKELNHYLEDLEEVITTQNNSVLKIKGNLILNKLNQLK